MTDQNEHDFQHDFESAVSYWDKAWTHEHHRAQWNEAEEDVKKVVPILHERNISHVCDLGCGTGRHALYLSHKGFKVTALDGSSTGIEYLNTQAHLAGLDIECVLGDTKTLPFNDDSFEYLLSWNVIYHGNRDEVQISISEIERVLTERGILQLTMLSKRNANFGIGTEISPGTWINSHATDKSHPHYYCDENDLVSLFSSFHVLEMKLAEHTNYEGAYHWHLLLEKKESESV